MFFLLPVGVDYRARRYPVVTFTLMGICVAVYLLTLGFTLAKGQEAAEFVVGNFWLIPAQSQWWTYLTSLFVHEGFFHVAGNMVYLFLFGSCVEDVIGRPRFLALYLLCGLASEYTHIAIAPDHFGSEVALGGASGAISGCIGAFLVLFLRTQIEFKWAVFLFFRLWSGEFFLPAWIVISFWFLSDLAGMLLGMAAADTSGGVAFGAHVGGTLCGLALIAIERKFRRAIPDDEPVEEEAPPSPAPARIARAPIRVQLKPSAAPVAVEVATIYLLIQDAQYGPYTRLQLQDMCAQGAIPADALYWQEGMDTWRNFEELRTARSG